MLCGFTPSLSYYKIVILQIRSISTLMSKTRIKSALRFSYSCQKIPSKSAV